MKINNSFISIMPTIAKAIVLSLITLLMLSGCKKYVEAETPPDKITAENTYNDPSSAASVLTGVYSRISARYFGGGLITISTLAELSADNLILYDLNALDENRQYYQNDLTPANPVSFWTNSYELLYSVNDVIENVGTGNKLPESVKNRLLGEACFMRAFIYFYLVNFYGDVPLALTTSAETNIHLSRTAESEVYQQITKDLSEAESKLSMSYVAADVNTTTSERVRPNLGAVYALQARVFLYNKNYAQAEAAATKVINESGLYQFTSLENCFLKNSKETIWAIQPVNLVLSTYPGFVYQLTFNGPDGFTNPFYLSTDLLDSFEPGDGRREKWVNYVTVGTDDYYYPYKYRQGIDENILSAADLLEYDIVLRLSEQYLIRAEARNELNNTSGAIEDINALRMRSRAAVSGTVPIPLPDLSLTLNQDQIRDAILKERRVELFTEWGHRWLDLKRSATIDAVMTSAQSFKGGNWENYKKLYPIPASDILLNPTITQNPHYVN
jgi:starch-binding outer membrane protein, SusD/RagB family